MRTLIVSGALLTALSLMACHSTRSASHPAASNNANSTASSTPTAAPSTLPPDVLALLKRYVPSQADLPSGYNIGGLVEVPNQQAVEDYADPNAANQELMDTGRQGGVGQQIFPPPTVSGTIGISIEAFKDVDGAQRWAKDPPSLPAVLNPTAVDPGGLIGDAASATHWTQGSQSGYILSFSRGRIVYGIGIAAPTGQESLAPAQELARSLDQKAQSQSN